MDNLLSKVGLDCPKESDIYSMLCREMLKGLINYLTLNQKRELGDYSESYQSGVATHASSQAGKLKASKRFSDVFPEYMDEKEIGGNWTAKTRSEIEAILQLFKDIVGDIPIEMFDYEKARDYKQKLMKIPANRNKIKSCREKSIDDILLMEDITPMSVRTINKNLEKTSSFLKWTVKNGYLTQNFLEGMVVKEKRSEQDERNIFTPDDLSILFNRKIFIEHRFKHSYFYWLPIIGLYTGMRINEICQLYLDDLRLLQKVFCPGFGLMRG